MVTYYKHTVLPTYRTNVSVLPSWLLGMQFSTGSLGLFPPPFCFFSFLLEDVEPDGTLPLDEPWLRGEELDPAPPPPPRFFVLFPAVAATAVGVAVSSLGI